LIPPGPILVRSRRSKPGVSHRDFLRFAWCDSSWAHFLF